MEERNYIKVVKRCPICDTRLFDKTSPTTGTIEIKCPQCKQIVIINLAFRRVLPNYGYRQVVRPRI